MTGAFTDPLGIDAPPQFSMQCLDPYLLCNNRGIVITSHFSVDVMLCFDTFGLQISITLYLLSILFYDHIQRIQLYRLRVSTLFIWEYSHPFCDESIAKQ